MLRERLREFDAARLEFQKQTLHIGDFDRRQN